MNFAGVFKSHEFWVMPAKSAIVGKPVSSCSIKINNKESIYKLTSCHNVSFSELILFYMARNKAAKSLIHIHNVRLWCQYTLFNVLKKIYFIQIFHQMFKMEVTIIFACILHTDLYMHLLLVSVFTLINKFIWISL